MSDRPKIGSMGLARGWHDGLPMADYLADPAVSASRLWSLHEQTPAHLLAEIESGADVVTDAKALGTITHSAVFEPEVFDDRYVVLGRCEGLKKDGDRCSNGGTFYRDGQSFCGVKGHDPYAGAPMEPGLELVQESDRLSAARMKAALFGHPTARELLEAEGMREVTGVCQDPKTGLWLRIRPDELIYEPPGTRSVFHSSVVNLKTTGKLAAPTKFPRDAERMGVYFKAAFYRLVIRELAFEPQNFFFPVVESFGEHQVIVYRLHEDALDIGESEVRLALDTLNHAVTTGEWPSYGAAIHDLNLSDWRLKQVHSIDFLEVG